MELRDRASLNPRDKFLKGGSFYLAIGVLEVESPSSFSSCKNI